MAGDADRLRLIAQSGAPVGLPAEDDPASDWAEFSVQELMTCSPRLTVVPLRVGDRLQGVLALDIPGERPAGLARILRIVGDTLAVALANANLHTQMQRQARLDDLTQLANRRAGLDRLGSELSIACATGVPVGVMLIDVDHFKLVNDTYGHQVGDEVLRHLAEAAAAQLRPGDLLCRYGGEEFLAVLPGADDEAVMSVAERLRAAVATTNWDRQSHGVAVTVSIGGTSTCASPTAWETVVSATDRALYAAKSAGRDRVRMATRRSGSPFSAEGAPSAEPPVGLRPTRRRT